MNICLIQTYLYTDINTYIVDAGTSARNELYWRCQNAFHHSKIITLANQSEK